MGSCLSLIEFARDMRRAQREDRSRVIVNVMIGRGPTFNISTRQEQTKRKENTEVEMKAGLRWSGMVKPIPGSFLMWRTQPISLVSYVVKTSSRRSARIR